MKIQNLKIYDKQGNDIGWNLYPLPELELDIKSLNGVNAKLIPVTNVDGYLLNCIPINKGYNYDAATTKLYLKDLNDPTSYIDLNTQTADIKATVIYENINVYNPNLSITNGIKDVEFAINKKFKFPSFTNACSVFLKPTSVGLIETESLYLFENTNISELLRPFDELGGSIVVSTTTGDSEIQLFDVDYDNQKVLWSNMLFYELNEQNSQTPIAINIGFKSATEGVFEQVININYYYNETMYLLGTIIVNAEAVGYENRYKKLSENFGLFDSNEIFSLFKESNINEHLPDYKLTNEKSKLLLLEYQNIMPFIGTYKALINSVKWLGYDDVYFKEWFKNVDPNDDNYNKLMTYVVPFNAKERKDTILQFSANERMSKFKKLNVLSMIYCLTKETGEVDDSNMPETVNCYSYSIDEILIKLYSLKKWLEQNIIGVNAKIIDIMGEGIYFEKFNNKIYSTQNYGINIHNNISLTLNTYTTNSELYNGDASIFMTLKELTSLTINDLQHSFSDLIDYVWNKNTGVVKDYSNYSLETYDLLVGSTFKYPLTNIQDIQYKTNINTSSSTLTEKIVDNPLFIYDNEIKFYNLNDTISTFDNVNNIITLSIEKGTLRDNTIDIWEDSILYEIDFDTETRKYFIKQNNTIIYTSYTPIIFMLSSVTTFLRYNRSNLYNGFPLLELKYNENNLATIPIDKREYILDIKDGFIGYENLFERNKISYINFNYDIPSDEQKIEVNYQYFSDRKVIYQYDPSVYYYKGADDPSVLVIDNGSYIQHVNHIGQYDLEVRAWDNYNNIYYDKLDSPYLVWMKKPTLNIYKEYEREDGIKNLSDLIGDYDKYPIFEINNALQELSVHLDSDGKPFIKLPSISYFMDTPNTNDIAKIFNLSEKCISIDKINKVLIIDTDFQKFKLGDKIKLYVRDNNSHNIIFSEEMTITSLSMFNDYATIVVDKINLDISILRPNHTVYIKNINLYKITPDNIINYNTTCILNFSDIEFDTNQLISIEIYDLSGLNAIWCSSYRILNKLGPNQYELDGVFPKNEICKNPNNISMYVKYAVTDFADYQVTVKSGIELNNEYNITLNDPYYLTYYLDNTFLFLNIIFDHNKVQLNWVNKDNYDFDSKIYMNYDKTTIKKGSVVLLTCTYDDPDYMLGERNKWRITDYNTGQTIMIVYNETIPFVFDVEGMYNVSVDTYDHYGNIINTVREGMIEVIS